MRVLAIDYGDARTGIAVSDLTGSIVGRTEVIHSRNAQKTAEAIRALAAETGAQALVMGFPRNMDGSEGPRAALYREFAALVEQVCAMPVTHHGRGASDPLGLQLPREKAQEHRRRRRGIAHPRGVSCVFEKITAVRGQAQCLTPDLLILKRKLP